MTPFKNGVYLPARLPLSGKPQRELFLPEPPEDERVACVLSGSCHPRPRPVSHDSGVALFLSVDAHQPGGVGGARNGQSPPSSASHFRLPTSRPQPTQGCN